MMKKMMKSVVAIVLAIVTMVVLFAPATVQAAPPPSYDEDGNPVAPPPFILTEVELPEGGGFDEEMNSYASGILKLIRDDGWLLRGVERHNDGLERVYTLERYTDVNYQTEFFLLYQKEGRFSLNGERYRSSFFVAFLYKFGIYSTEYAIY